MPAKNPVGRPAVKPDTTTPAGRIGAAIRRARRRRKLSVEEAAEKCGLTVAWWYAHEHGDRTTSLADLQAVAKGLGVGLATLLR